MAETVSPTPSRPFAPSARARPAAPPLPGTGPLLGAQVRYQLLLLLTRNPRALIGSLVIPVLLLVLSSSRHANLTPKPIIDAATRALRQTGGVPQIPGHDLAVLAAWAVAGVVASVGFFRWDPVRPRHARLP